MCFGVEWFNSWIKHNSLRRWINQQVILRWIIPRKFFRWIIFLNFFLQYLQNSLNHSTKPKLLVHSTVEWFHQNYFRWMIPRFFRGMNPLFTVRWIIFSLFHSTDQTSLYHLEIFATCCIRHKPNRLYFTRVATFLEWLKTLFAEQWESLFHFPIRVWTVHFQFEHACGLPFMFFEVF